MCWAQLSFSPVAWSDNKITYHLFKAECGLRGLTETCCPFSHHIPFHWGKSDPSQDFPDRQDNLTCSKMTLLPHLTLIPPTPISSQGAELAQTRDTLKNKLLIWDWVDSDGWPVLKGTEKRSGWVSLLFQCIQGTDVLPHMAFSQSKGLGH